MKVKLPVTWTMSGEIEVEANSIQEAIDNFNADEHDLPDGDYVGDSFELSFDDIEAIKDMQ